MDVVYGLQSGECPSVSLEQCLLTLVEVSISSTEGRDDPPSIRPAVGNSRDSRETDRSSCGLFTTLICHAGTNWLLEVLMD